MVRRRLGKVSRGLRRAPSHNCGRYGCLGLGPRGSSVMVTVCALFIASGLWTGSSHLQQLQRGRAPLCPFSAGAVMFSPWRAKQSTAPSDR